MSAVQYPAVLDAVEGCPADLIEVLQDIQTECSYLPEDALRAVSEKLSVPLIEVFRAANFFKAFTLVPRGRHLITVCQGTACHVRGASRLLDAVSGLLEVSPGETTGDGAFTLEAVNCLGACALGPVLVMDGRCYAHMTPDKLRRLIARTIKQDEEGSAND